MVKCHAGCSQEAVIQALKDRDLWTNEQSGDWREYYAPWGTPYRYPAEWGEIVATYPYRDEDGKLLYQVCRFVPKSFRPLRPISPDSKPWGYGDVRRILYHLPEVIEAPIVFVVEGERDAESLRDQGFIATTNPGGAKAWRPEYAEYLRGREVFILPDRDAAGAAWARDVARSLLGIAARIWLLELPGTAKDVSDWFAEGHSEVELIYHLDGKVDSCR